MSTGLWVGAATTLAGVGLGGAISLALNRQQMKDARAQRMEDDRRIGQRHSADRRFGAYAAFFTNARFYRDALRPLQARSGSKAQLSELDDVEEE
jgi:hypothetical protein